jgi:hypothetical protein
MIAKVGSMELDWKDSILKLSEVRACDYFKRRAMPAFVEPLVTEIVTSLVCSDEARREELLSLVSRSVCPAFGWYARKLAGRAVRERSRSDLWNGVVALGMCARVDDMRDLMAPLALVHNSAIRLGEDARALFGSASRMCGQSIETLFMEFLDGPSCARAIGTYGFSEGAGPCGFDYIPLLPEYGGLTPLSDE